MASIESKNTFRKYLIPVLTLIAGFLIGFLARDAIHGRQTHKAYEIRQGGWKLINPLLEIEQAQEVIEDTELLPFKNRLDRFIQKNLRKKWGDEVSVYFRELNDGLAFTVGEDEQFYPASLLKVPEMMSILKRAEADPKFLKKKIAYDRSDLKSAQNTDVAEPLVFGRSYSIEEMLKRMIIYSDNISSLLLEETMNPRDLRRVYDDLGVPDPYDLNDQSGFEMSTETYSSFFRILFNASYLSKENSEKALEYLSQTTYKKGLVAGVPPDIAVSHKFGLRKINGVKQLHDCGIVYYPGHPYLLCIMTSGPVPEYLDTTIGEISHFIYGEIDRQHRQ